MPERIHRKRTKGWRMPGGAIYVGRPTKWGNPFVVGRRTHLWHRATTHPYAFYRDWFTVVDAAQAVRLYRAVLTDRESWLDTWSLADGWGEQLRGHDLACWCPLDQPCHADVLLELANG